MDVPFALSHTPESPYAGACMNANLTLCSTLCLLILIGPGVSADDLTPPLTTDAAIQTAIEQVHAARPCPNPSGEQANATWCNPILFELDRTTECLYANRNSTGGGPACATGVICIEFIQGTMPGPKDLVAALVPRPVPEAQGYTFFGGYATPMHWQVPGSLSQPAFGALVPGSYVVKQGTCST